MHAPQCKQGFEGSRHDSFELGMGRCLSKHLPKAYTVETLAVKTATSSEFVGLTWHWAPDLSSVVAAELKGLAR